MHKIFANSLFIGKKIEILPHCHSTNKIAGQMLGSGEAPEGTIILTHNQTAGKGQRGNSWESEPGKNLTFSLVLNPRFLSVRDQFFLNIITSLAVAETLERELGPWVKVKWPNDIYAKDQKICGILIENGLRGSTIESSVVGIGLNVNQTSFETGKATSMSEMTLKEYDLELLLEELVYSLERQYIRLRKGELKQLKREYHDKLYWMNEVHLFESEEVFSGQITGVDAQGKLVIQIAGQDSSFDIKEIRFIK